MSKIKVGVIGSGGIARGCHIVGYQSIPEECELVWVCDIDAALAERTAKENGIPHWGTDYNTMLAEHPVDAVSVTTPNRYHLEPTVAALNAGVHVLCEKPLAMTGAEAKQMVDAAKRSGKILQVALQWRFSGAGQFMKKYIDSGEMGDIYYARAQALRRRNVPAWGVFIDKEQQGGGPLIDIGVHILDFTLFLMGYPKPVSVSASTWNTLGTNPNLFNFWGDYDRAKFTVEDMAVGFIRFEGGKTVVLESSFMANMDEQERFASSLFGTTAGADIRLGHDGGIRIYSEKNGQLFDLSPRNVQYVKSEHTLEVQAFIRAIASGADSPVPGEHGMTLNAIFDALYRSAAEQKEIAVEL